MIWVFGDNVIPQHVSKIEEWAEEDYDPEDEKINEEHMDGSKGSGSETAESYTLVLGVKIGYSDAKAIAGMEVVEVFGSYMPENVLGMTDCTNKIWIRYGLGYLKKHVLIHEIEHVKDPAASEYAIRMRAKQREPTHYVL